MLIAPPSQQILTYLACSRRSRQISSNLRSRAVRTVAGAAIAIVRIGQGQYRLSMTAQVAAATSRLVPRSAIAVECGARSCALSASTTLTSGTSSPSSRCNSMDSRFPMRMKRLVVFASALLNASFVQAATGAVAPPSIAETKAIAEEGFIYGLPLVMNYAVMNEFAVDTKSSQFKAPFNEINNEHRVCYLRRHGGHHAEQRHALLDSLAGSARGADGDLGAGGGEEALLRGAADRRQYLQLWLHRQPRHRERGRATTSSSAPTGKARRPPGSRRSFTSTTPVLARAVPDPALQSRRHAERREGAGRLQGAAAFRVPQATRAAGRAEDRFPPGHHRGDQGELLRVSRRRPAVRPADAGGQGHPRQARAASASARARPSSSRICRSNTRPPSCWA